MRIFSLAVTSMLASLATAPCLLAQITVPAKQYQTLKVELESLRDDITLYQGDPQQLLLMDVRPNRFRPRIDYYDQTNATLRIRDLYAVDHPDFASKTPAERDKEGDPPLQEMWEIRLSPVQPTHFSLACERGKSSFDFSNIQVQRVEMRADETQVDVEFSSPNPVQLERFAARVIAGSLRFQGMINARAREITLDLPGSECHLEITGDAFEGESKITCLGEPSQMQILVSRKVGLRVTGPAATIARFAASHMSRSGEDWVSKNYASSKCRIALAFGSEVPKLDVEWE